MTHYQTPKRRILTLPAVCPCEAISPATLLSSLISLVSEVAFRKADPETYPIHRRSVREVSRIAGVLLSFLEDVRDNGSLFPGPAVLSFSELHVALQKIRYLLKDCAKKGARLWLLVKSDCVASEFRVFIGSVATALDVLPLDGIDVSPDAKELVMLLSMQARRSLAARMEKEDDRGARSVRSILDQFKNGVAPDAEDLMRILGRLGIRSWSDCTEEVSFLEGELLERLEDGGDRNGDKDLSVIDSLMAFMIYCRAVLFEHADGRKAELKSPPRKLVSASWLNRDALQCPISLELMTDPVTIATGQTYDRPSIKKWLKSGCRTCPVTGAKLGSIELVSNSAVRIIVEQFCLNKGMPMPEASTNKHRHSVGKTASPFSQAAAGAIRLAVVFLIGKLSKGTPVEKKKATYEIRKLSKYNIFHRACFVEADAVPWLLYLLSSFDPSTQDNAIAALLNLSKNPDGRKSLVEAGGLGLIVDVINCGLKVEAQQNAAAVLFYLSSVNEYCEEIGQIPEAIPTLVQLAREGAYRGRKNALVSLFGLLKCHCNYPKIVTAGVLPVLANLLSSDCDDLVNDSVSLLEKIAERKEGTDAILRNPAIVSRLVEVLASSTSRSGKEHCVSLLLSLCSNGGDDVVGVLGEIPGLMSSLYSLLAEGSPQASKKARSLLNEIHRHFELFRPTIAPTSVGDRIIRAVL